MTQVAIRVCMTEDLFWGWMINSMYRCVKLFYGKFNEFIHSLLINPSLSRDFEQILLVGALMNQLNTTSIRLTVNESNGRSVFSLPQLS